MRHPTILSMTLFGASALIAGFASAQVSWDLNADGMLDPGEFVGGFGNLGTFQRFDVNMDGSLDAAEWENGLGTVGEYVNMDLNADGGVDEAEFNALLFNRYDDDGSGTIGGDEITMIEADLSEDGLLSR